MFATTFLGHQGWLFQTERTALLVDPLLCPEFGHAHGLEYSVFPPRIVKPESFPRIDALVLTHEHDDHFDIPSLMQLDRRIPIFLSARSSMAGLRILLEMGFRVQPLSPGRSYQFGDLDFSPFCGDHVNTNSGDEWDTLPFLVRQLDGDGSFFSMVDCTLTPHHIDLARALLPKPGLCSWTNNALDWSHMTNYVAERIEGTAQGIERLRAGHALLSTRWGQPAAMLACAGGFSFHGSKQWLNQRVFCVDMERVCKTLEAATPRQRFFATRPGQTFTMVGNVLLRIDQQTPFLSCVPQKDWPSRQRVPVTQFPDYLPASGRIELTEEEADELRDRLGDFATALVGGTLFRSLYSLMDSEAPGRLLTFAFSLRHGSPEQKLVLMYNPCSAGFDDSEVESPDAVFVAGMECWASDLLAMLRGEMGAIALNFGRAKMWNSLPQRFNFELGSELYRFSHPLSRPVEFHRTYTRLLRAAETTAKPPTILARPPSGEPEATP